MAENINQRHIHAADKALVGILRQRGGTFVAGTMGEALKLTPNNKGVHPQGMEQALRERRNMGHIAINRIGCEPPRYRVRTTGKGALAMNVQLD